MLEAQVRDFTDLSEFTDLGNFTDLSDFTAHVGGPSARFDLVELHAGIAYAGLNRLDSLRWGRRKKGEGRMNEEAGRRTTEEGGRKKE